MSGFEMEEKRKQEILQEIEERKGKFVIPKTNEEFVKEFKNSVEKYKNYQSNQWKEMTKKDFCYEFIGVGINSGTEIMRYETLKIPVEYEINKYIENTSELLKEIVKINKSKLIEIGVPMYLNYIFEKIEDYIMELEPINKILVEGKITALQGIGILPIYELLNANYEIILKDIEELIWDNPKPRIEVNPLVKENWCDYAIEMLLYNIGQKGLIPLPLNLDTDAEWGIVEELDGLYYIEKDIQNGKIKNIKEFDFGQYFD